MVFLTFLSSITPEDKTLHVDESLQNGFTLTGNPEAQELMQAVLMEIAEEMTDLQEGEQTDNAPFCKMM